MACTIFTVLYIIGIMAILLCVKNKLVYSLIVDTVKLTSLKLTHIYYMILRDNLLLQS